MHFILDWNEYAAKAREVVTEGCVLLKNDRQALPLRKGSRVSVFGRIQMDYWYMKSGTGSGGMVNAPYAIGVTEGLREAGIGINEELLAAYQKFEEENPFDKGAGWAQEPFCQKEMPLTDEMVQKAAEDSDAAIVIIARWCGEDRDLTRTPGSWYLTEDERTMLRKVTGAFSRTIVLLNCGSIIDMQWVKEYDPAAVMYIWQGGQEGGRGVADLLTGKVSPSGKLSDTIAETIEDYPSTAHFGNPKRNIYADDIYVGYRYFETFAKNKVLYPFGFGLSYTTFESRVVRFDIRKPTAGEAAAEEKEAAVILTVEVMNTGAASGKETIQVYWKAPEDAPLTGAARNLAGFAKTGMLRPGESERLQIVIPVSSMASYDDAGVTGFRSAWVLPAGRYELYAGSDVRRAAFAGQYVVPETVLVKQCEEALSPVIPFERMVNRNGSVVMEAVPTRSYDLAERIRDGEPGYENMQGPETGSNDRPSGTGQKSECTGDHGIRLSDVKAGRASMEEFLAQIPDEELIQLTRGEGMCSSKVTPGIAGAMGGVTEGLKQFGIPAAGVSDGPSGIRRDNGAMAFSNPNGVTMACTFHPELIRELYEFQGMELRRSRIDSLLGPGINIHRNPMNGRNFEYFSEDPYLTGEMASAALLGMERYGTTGTIKHFCANSQETARARADAVVSERALREIYLKAFEMAVHKGKASCIMTSYGPVNGIWTSSSYDLDTTILRKEWGFRGLVMTDWVADMSGNLGPDASIEEYRKLWTADGGPAVHNVTIHKSISKQNTAAMIAAQNDVYMVSADSAANAMDDNAEEALQAGEISRGELLRNAGNICRVLMNMPCEEFLEGAEDAVIEKNRPADREGTVYEQPVTDMSRAADVATLDIRGLHTEARSVNVFLLTGCGDEKYRMEVTLSSKLEGLAQTNVSLFLGGTFKSGFTLYGNEHEPVTRELPFDGYPGNRVVKLLFAQDGAVVQSIRVRRVK